MKHPACDLDVRVNCDDEVVIQPPMGGLIPAPVAVMTPAAALRLAERIRSAAQEAMNG